MSVFKSDPRLYSVPFNDFYQAFDLKICEKEMENLINRYGIHNKDILSIGSGTAHEEYWFCVKGDNRLILFDIDESGTIEPKLKTLSTPSLSANTAANQPIQYYIGDFTKFKKGFSNQFDILYLSSFTPDELRRDTIKTAFGKKVKVDPWKKVIYDILHREKQEDLNWPYWCAPFHESVYHSLSFVKRRGLVILQSYCGGIDVTYNPNYVNKIKKDFTQYGITLLDLFYLEASPAITLTVGFAGNEEEAKAFYHEQVKSVPLESFHGRSAVDNKAKQLYSLCP